MSEMITYCPLLLLDVVDGVDVAVVAAIVVVVAVAVAVVVVVHCCCCCCFVVCHATR